MPGVDVFKVGEGREFQVTVKGGQPAFVRIFLAYIDSFSSSTIRLELKDLPSLAA